MDGTKFFDKIGAEKMLHTNPLTLNKEFRRAYYRGRAFTTSVVVVYILKNHKGINRIGLTASKKIGNAVRRNRARRLMKEAYRLLEEKLPVGYDFVLVARTRTFDARMPELMKAIENAVLKLQKQV